MPTVSATPPWIFRPKPRPNAALRLYCFPFAGGAAHAYSPWGRQFSENIEVRAVQLPGRGPRVTEPLFERIEPLVDAVTKALLDEWSQGPFALYGHSMGGCIVFELARRLRQLRGPQPVAVAISGRPSPTSGVERERRLSEMSDDDLWSELAVYNGTPPELLADPEVRRFFLPIVRADFTIVDNYTCVAQPPLDCPLNIAIGVLDPATPPDSETAWAIETTADCVIRRYNGDHFFIRSHAAEFVPTLDADLQPLIRRR